MKIQIKTRSSHTVIFETDAESLGAAVLVALATGAVLTGAVLRKLLTTRTILPDGDLIGWKKLQNEQICKLRIPANAKRVGGLIGRKCRAEFADVLEGEGCAIHNGIGTETNPVPHGTV